jgi:exonuclease SbcD
LLLVGNHDISPASGRAHTLQEFSTLDVPQIHVADTIQFWGPQELGIPVQIITVPWVSRSKLMTREESAGMSLDELLEAIENRVTQAVLNSINEADPGLPLVLSAHASVQGATYGSERGVMLGHELVLGGRIVSDKRLDYVALGHIHKHQALNPPGSQPPIVYPGSIERIDFGEAKERKGFIIAEISKGKGEWQFIPLKTRRFLDVQVDTPAANTFMQDVLEQLPKRELLNEAVCRLQLNYPADWEPMLDEKQLIDYFDQAFSLQIVKRRQSEKRARLGDTVAVESLSPMELLDIYWRSTELEGEEIEAMAALAKEILGAGEE